jgi:tetratricopeptide (TPR) repeat protein
MFSYAYDPQLSYTDHLRLRDSMNKAVRPVVVGQALNTMAVMANTAAVAAVGAEVRAVREALDWGFSSVLDHLAQMNTSLEELQRIARSPAQVAAYEQFDLARENFRNRLYPECLQRLRYAIHGEKAANSKGLVEEWRFHLLEADVYLGCPDRSLINLPKAEQSYLSAARYARASFPVAASMAMHGACNAAYAQGKMSEAERYGKDACNLAPQRTEPILMLARVHCCLKRLREAFPLLKQAVKLDISCAEKIPNDPDFRRFSLTATDFWKSWMAEAQRDATNAIQKTWPLLGRLRQWLDTDDSSTSVYQTLKQDGSFQSQRKEYRESCAAIGRLYERALRRLQFAERLAQENTLYGHLKAHEVAFEAAQIGQEVKATLPEVETLLETVEVKAEVKAEVRHRGLIRRLIIGALCGGVPATLLSLMIALVNLGASPDGHGIAMTLVWAVILVPLGLGIGLLGGYVMDILNR